MQTESPKICRPTDRRCQRLTWILGALLGCAIAWFPQWGHAQVYRWVDENGVTHLSSEKPPPGVKAERIEIKTSSPSSKAGTAGQRSGSSGRNSPPPAPPEQVAAREDLLGRLRTRECVIALETLERKTSGTEPSSAEEIRRLKQTTDQNCSSDPVRRRQQEDLAARLRVANGPECLEARNRLADMSAPGATASREQLRMQQAFVDEHCTSPVR
jgi:hypothetical protein